MGARAALGIAMLAASCVKPTEFTTCGDFTCGIGAICSPDGTRCVDPETVYACDGIADGDRCQYTGVPDGVCQGGICQAGGCGNGIVETAIGEVCDDGNFVSGDGCRGDCKSMEMCGDGIQDLAAGELCDCGSGAMSIAGCSGPNAETPGATCRTNCKPARCGDGVLDAPDEVCDDGGPDAPPPVSGDGCAADCSGRWTRMLSGTLATLRDVDARSATDAWAVGDQTILRYDGQAWLPVPLPPGASTAQFTSVHLAASGDAFVIGRASPTAGSTSVFRYHAGAWAALTYDNINIRWNAVGGTGTEIYLVGIYNLTSSRAAKYNAATQPPSFVNENIAGGSAAELWKITVAPDGSPYAAERDSGGAPSVFGPSAVAGGWTFVGPQGSLVNAPANDQLFVFDVDSAGSLWNGGVSTPIANSDELTVLNDSDAIPGLALVVGGRGGTMLCTTSACSISPTGILSDLYGAALVDSNHAFLVGQDGTILY